MDNKTQIKIQTLRDELAIAKANLKKEKAALRDLDHKCTAEENRAGKIERVSDSVFRRRWEALEKEQEEAKEKIYKDYDVLEKAEVKLEKSVGALDYTIDVLYEKLNALLDKEAARKKQKRERAQHCKQCNKIKPQAPIVCHCK